MSKVMQVAVFVAGEDEQPNDRDSNEFSRYYRSFVRRFEDGFIDVDPRKHQGRNIHRDAQPFRHLLYKSDSGDFAVIVADKNNVLRQVTAELKKEGEFTEEISKTVLKEVSELVKLVGARERELEVSMFAHWHVEPFSVECSFNKWLKNKDEDVRQLAGVTKFEQFAVSSRRKRQFDLSPDDGLLAIPANGEELRNLKAGFGADPKARVQSGEIKIELTAKRQFANLKDKPFVLIPAEANVWMDELCDALIALMKSKDICCFNPGDGAASLPERLFPIFVAWDNRDRVGSTVPAEFILQFESEMLGDTILNELSFRMEQWKLDAKLKDGVPRVELKEWCCSLFRRYIFLDEEVHADSNIDYSSLKRGEGLCPDDKRTLVSRLKQLKTDKHYNRLWNWLYADALGVLNAIATSEQPSDQKGVCDRLCDLPTPNGSEIVYFIPDRRLNALVLDDDIAKQEDRFKVAILEKVFGKFERIERIDKGIQSGKERHPDAWGSVCLETRRDNLEFVIDNIKRLSRDHRGFDVVLVDLNLGDKAGQDPSGYQLINKLKIFYPSVPVVAYSRYDDMGHISRAFKIGASWFIKKDEVDKLPRHLLSIYKHRDWEGEWATINELIYKESKSFELHVIEKDKNGFKKKFDNARKFLTYKCMEKYPGEVVYVKPMSGGFSSAVTFRAVKGKVGESEDGHRQTPVIIKIDSYYNTMSEYERYFRFIRPYIANEAGRVESPEIKLDNERSAIVYTFAGKPGSSRELVTLKECLKRDMRNIATCDFGHYEKVFDELFDDILCGIHKVTPENEGDERFSSYPNPSFGEHGTQLGESNNGFVANYVKRIALARHVNDTKFVVGGGKILEFHMFTRDGEIEAYDYDDGMTVMLKGESVKHVAKFRKEILPGRPLRIAGIWDLKDDGAARVSQDDEILTLVAKAFPYIKGAYKDSSEGEKNIRDAIENIEKMSKSGDDEKTRKKLRDITGDYGGCIERELLKILNELLPDGKSISFSFGSIVEKTYSQFEEYLKDHNNTLEKELPVGIVHGDLNYANIMLDVDGNGSGKDVWLIDFARTRRDVVAHDFNVIFTSTVALLFANELWAGNKPVPGAKNYRTKLKRIFSYLIEDVIFNDRSDAEPDYIADDKRFILIYKILRRIRRAALSRGMNNESYAVTTALCCLYTFRIMLKYEHSVPAAAAMLAIASMIYSQLTLKRKCHDAA